MRNQLKNAMLARLLQEQASSFTGRRYRKAQQGYFTGYETALVPGSTAGVIEQGERSRYNAEKPLHRQSIKLVIDNTTDVTDYLNAVITAGDHEAEYSGKVLVAGTSAYTNDAAATVDSVTVSADFGIGGSGSVLKMQNMIRRKGILVLGMRFRYTTSSDQLVNKIQFRQYDEFGNHGWDEIDLEVDFHPNQYQANIIDVPLRFILNRDTTMQLKVDAGEKVSITLYVSALYNADNVLQQYAKRQGSNILL